MEKIDIRKYLTIACIIALFVWISFFQQLFFGRYDLGVRICLIGILALQIKSLKDVKTIFNFRSDWPQWLFLLCLLAGTVNATNKTVVWERYFYLATTFLLLFYVGKCLYRNEKNVKFICLTICSCSILVVLIGFAELYFGRNIIYEKYIANPFYARYFAGIAPPAELERYVRYAPCPLSTQFVPAVLGSYLLGCLPFSFYFFKSKSVGLRLTGVIASLLCAIMIILSLSRGALLGLVALLLFYLWHKNRKGTKIIMSCLILLMLLGSFWSNSRLSRFGFTEMIYGRYDSIISEHRLSRIKMTKNILREYPFFGIGLEHFRIRFNEYSEKKDKETVPYEFMIPDNMYLTLLSETGLIGTAGFIIFLSLLFKYGIRQINKLNDCINRESLLVPLSAVIGLLVAMAGYELFYWHSPYMLFGLITGFIQGCGD
ncbi:O-antigen ligase family protein [Candidatus Omnitrophota bacterium]